MKHLFLRGLSSEVCFSRSSTFYKIKISLPSPAVISDHSFWCHSAIAPPRGGGEASLKEQYEAGLEHREAEQESGLMWLALEGEHARAALANPVLVPVAMDNKVGRLRKREEHSPTPGAVAPPRNI
ncbi:hypothetical protein KOW79_010504 [Hemibagrus wyckioides]|uniref:Uncharacterized protein n=1 Tax=Hemibagrus wyckioides TaxID=337641 RepID=A0A9D3SNA2_9TELE|nr:hypothetical protein KOW79_010504 [Hemibagrus wyckioides]